MRQAAFDVALRKQQRGIQSGSIVRLDFELQWLVQIVKNPRACVSQKTRHEPVGADAPGARQMRIDGGVMRWENLSVKVLPSGANVA